MLRKEIDLKEQLQVISDSITVLLMDKRVSTCDALYGYLHMAKLSMDCAVLKSNQFSCHDETGI